MHKFLFCLVVMFGNNIIASNDAQKMLFYLERGRTAEPSKATSQLIQSILNIDKP